MVKETENPVKMTRAPRKTAETSVSGAKIIRKSEIANRIDDDKVGTMLYHERIKKGLDMAQISQTLCIRSFYLDAIEKGNYGELPPIPYSVGFVSSYAKYLGMNHTRIAQLFREEISAKPSKTPIFITEETPAEAALPQKVYIIAVIAVIALTAAFWSFFSPSAYFDLGDDEAVAEVAADENIPETVSSAGEVEYFESEAESAAPVVEEPVLSEEKESEEAPVAEVNEPEAESEKAAESDNQAAVEEKPEVDVEIKITRENAWIEVRDDKKVYFNRVLKVGESYRLPNLHGLRVSAGKVRGVEVYVNGELKPVITATSKRNVQIDEFLNENH